MRDQLLIYRQHLLERLNTVRDNLVKAAATIAPEKWHTVADQESPHRILANLRSVEEQAFSLRLRRILDEDEPFLPLFDDKKWMEDHYNPGEPYEDILAEYIALRGKELTWLNELSAQDWNRTGRHPWWGVRSLQWWVEQILRFSEEQLQRLKITSSGRTSSSLM